MPLPLAAPSSIYRKKTRIRGTLSEFVMLDVDGSASLETQRILETLPLLHRSILFASMNLKEMRLDLAIQPELSWDEIQGLITRLGFKSRAVAFKDEYGDFDRQQSGYIFDFPEIKLKEVCLAAACTLALLMIGSNQGEPGAVLPIVGIFCVAFFVPLLMYCLRSEWKFAFRQIKNYGITANLPPLVGFLAGTLLGIFECSQDQWPTSLEVTSFFATFWLLSEFYGWHLQKTFVRRIDGLSSFLPVEVLKWDANKLRFYKIPRAMIRGQDRLLIEPGARIPTAGRVLEGESEIDARVLTGDPRLIRVHPGSNVQAGSLNGRFPIEIQVYDNDGIAGGVRPFSSLNLVQNQEGFFGLHRALSIIAILPICAAAVIFATTDATLQQCLLQTAVFSFITNPRLFLLIIPSQLQRALVWARQHEFFVFNRRVFERVGRIRNLIFGKNGILTTAEYEVTHSLTLSPSNLPIRELALALQLQSPHPLSHAIVHHLKEDGVIPAQDVTIGELQPGHVIVGTWKNHQLKLQRLDGGVDTAVGFSIDGHLYTQFYLTDHLREQSAAAIKALQKEAKLFLLSGDSDSSIEKIRRGMEREVGGLKFEVYGRQTADLKQKFVQGHHPSLVIGDSTEDRLSLAHADVALVMSGSLESSVGVADVYTLEPNLQNVVKFIQFSRSYRFRMIALTTLAVIYHLIAFTLVFEGMIPFQLAAFLMPGTSLLIYFLIIPLRPELSLKSQPPVAMAT